MQRSFTAILFIISALFADLARAEDTILVLDDGKVELCVGAYPPNERVDPHSLIIGSGIWASDRSSKGFGARLQAWSEGGVGIASRKNTLLLAYSRETHFAPLDMSLRGDPGQIEYGQRLLDEALAKVVPPVTQRAQALGAKTDGMQVTGLAYADLDGDGPLEIIVEARSTPDFAGSETARSGQFAGVFVLSANGSPLGERIQILGREDSGSRYQFRVAAIGRNPFAQTTSARWDFLIEEVSQHLNSEDEADRSGGYTQYRIIEIRTFDAGKFIRRPRLSLITCSGADCPN